jgi:hypothetical protein
MKTSVRAGESCRNRFSAVLKRFDGLIAGTAAWLGIPILTNDPAITASQHVQTIW